VERPRYEGIDKDTHTGYLYAVGHAKGTSTLIQNLGKVTGTLDAAFYSRMNLDTSEAGNCSASGPGPPPHTNY
jgi:hypothetical protein